jgi:hypothetical protein
MKRLLLAAALLCACVNPANSDCLRVWQPAPDREDARACNAARAGDWAGAQARFNDCMHSLGYREVCQ